MEKLIERVKKIIMNPKQEWPVIAQEPGSSMDLVKEYVVYLAVIPVAAQFLRMLFSLHTGLFGGLVWAVVYFALLIVSLYVSAYVINALAPSFGGQKDEQAAFKLVAYSYTPVFLVGVFKLIPVFAIFGILGLYGIYLFYVGLPVLMKNPPEKSLAYTAVAFVVLLVISVLIGLISVALMCAT